MAKQIKSNPPHKHRIPYGVADYIKLRQNDEFYLDKTHYFPLLEQTGRFMFIIRPRRFGKSLLQSVMECYYDINRAEQFDQLFTGTWIHKNPTPEKHRYMVLRFDFSLVHGKGEALENSFETYCRTQLQDFMRTYANYLPAQVEEYLQLTGIPAIFNTLLTNMRQHGSPPLYLFIDEYDNFANTLLSTEGRQAYQQLTHGRGFFRDFFAELKGASGMTGGALSRLFITGVSPVTLDDVTSGFNIGSNISLEPRFQALLGFTATEMETLFSAFGHNYHEHKAILNTWYNNYRFAEEVTQTVTNSDMALYYLQSLVNENKPPRELIDNNVRIDYSKLRHIIQLDRHLNGSFDRLQQIIDEGRIVSPIQTSFPAERLQESDSFISLLYYFGLLTMSGEIEEAAPVLIIPNRTIEQLMYGYIRSAFDDVGLFRIDLYLIETKLRGMAWRADWQPFFAYLSDQIHQQSGIRDYIDGEKMIQGFLLAWLNLNPWFIVTSEREQNRGFVDLLLQPDRLRYPELKHTYLIELKYLSRAKYTEDGQQNAISKAKKQLQQYQKDHNLQASLGEDGVLHSLILVYKGWELVHCEEIMGF